MGKSILFVANVCKEHVLKFHVPTIKALKEDGWTVDVACSGDEQVPYCNHQYHLSWKRSPFSPKLLVGILELKYIIKNNHYDIIYCHTPVGGLVARIAGRKARKTGTKIIYFAHGFHFYKGAPPQNWIVFFLIEKYLSKWTDYLITINEEDYQYAFKNKMYQNGIFKIPGIGIDFDRLQEPEGTNWKSKIRDEFNIGESDIVLAYVAEIILNKNQGKLIDVIDVLSEKYPNIKLFLIGPEHDGGKLAMYTEKKGLKDKVIFTGWRNDIGAFLFASDIVVASSIREGLPLNLIEALACGRPIVAFDNRGHREIVANGVNGYLVKMDDVITMVEKIKIILEKEYKIMSKNAIENSEKYDQNVVALNIVQLLNSIE